MRQKTVDMLRFAYSVLLENKPVNYPTAKAGGFCAKEFGDTTGSMRSAAPVE